eukprot:gene24609-10228_t
MLRAVSSREGSLQKIIHPGITVHEESEADKAEGDKAAAVKASTANNSALSAAAALMFASLPASALSRAWQCGRTQVLFATDVAARGLDIQKVDWVVQFDCPEDVACYIHRVGRTARYMSSGRSLMLLLPSEKEGMVKLMTEAKVPVKQIKMNPNKALPVAPALQALLSKNVDLKEYAQRALVAYVRSVFLQPNKDVFDVTKIPIAEAAESMGLLTAPKLRFLKKVGKKTKTIEVGGPTDAVRALHKAADVPAASGSDDSEDDTPPTKDQKKAQKAAKSAKKEQSAKESAKQQDMPHIKDQKKAPAAAKSAKKEQSATQSAKQQAEDEGDDFLTIKKRHTGSESEEEEEEMVAGPPGAADLEGAGKLPKKKKKPKIKVGKTTGSRVVFDEDGEAMDPLERLAKIPDNADGEGDGVYAVNKTAADRFKVAADIMRKKLPVQSTVNHAEPFKVAADIMRKQVAQKVLKS